MTSFLTFAYETTLFNRFSPFPPSRKGITPPFLLVKLLGPLRRKIISFPGLVFNFLQAPGPLSNYPLPIDLINQSFDYLLVISIQYFAVYKHPQLFHGINCLNRSDEANKQDVTSTICLNKYLCQTQTQGTLLCSVDT